MNKIDGTVITVIICLIMLGIGTASALSINITNNGYDANITLKPNTDAGGEYEPMTVNLVAGETKQVSFNYLMTPTPTITVTETPIITATATPIPTPTPTSTPVQNIIVNGDFSAGKTNWAFYTNGAGSFDAVNSYAMVSITKVGTNVQLLQNKITLDSASTYQLSFDAYSNTGHDMKIGLLKDVSPYTTYLPAYTVPLTTSWKTFSYKFNMTTTESNARFRFWFANLATSGDVFYIDNVKLEKVIVSNNALQHPFLIINQSLYPELQAKQTQPPYSIWKSQAINELTLTYPITGTIREKAETIRDMSGSSALMSILDPVNKTTYAAKYVTGMNNWNEFNTVLLAETAPENIECLSAGTAFFETVLGLDILYNDLTDTQRSAIEAKLQEMLPFLDRCQWRQNTYAVKGLWALYNSQDATSYINGYNTEMFRSISETGVYVDGALYATSRMSDPIKETKGYFLDVVEFTGKGKYYSDPRMQNFYEWMFGYTTVPNKNQSWIFGDALPETALNEGGAAPYRAYKFSDKAAGYGNWFINNNYSTHTSGFMHYILGKELPEPLTPTSRVFSDAAYLLEGNDNNKSLGGAINNIKTDNFHAHYETNAIALTGYGETLMRGIGAAYGRLETLPSMKVNTVTRTQTAELGNTVTIDGVNHVQKNGLGITESLLTPEFDYVMGDSGSALPNGKHIRNFMFVHPQDGENGYWITLDEISSATGSTANVIFHPNSDLMPTYNPSTEYTWDINKNIVFNDNSVDMTIFLGTQPTSAIIKDGLMAIDLDYNFMGKYLYSTYNLVAGKKNIVTVLYPSNITHSKANMSRISGSEFSGAKINQDVALESSVIASYENVDFRGFIWHRLNSSKYFLNGNYFYTNGYGFSSNNNVTLFMNNNKGKIVSNGAIVSFTYLGLTSIKIDGIEQSIISSESNKVTINVASGTHDIELI